MKSSIEQALPWFNPEEQKRRVAETDRATRDADKARAESAMVIDRLSKHAEFMVSEAVKAEAASVERHLKRGKA